MKTIKLYLLEIIFVSLLFLFYITSLNGDFSYLGYHIESHIVSSYLVLFGLVNLNFILSKFIKHRVMFFVFKTNSILFLYPIFIFILLTQADYYYLLIVMLPNFTLSFISFFTKKHASINVKSSLRSINVRYYIIFLFILLIPYLMRLPNANIRNLLFLDVYDSRIDFRGTGSIYLNYFTATLSKLIIPIILMLSLKHKNYFGVLLSFISIIVIFLTTGALKSVLLSYGIFAFFIFGNSVNKKVFNFIIVINIIVLFEILSYTLLGQAIFSSYIRRIFFTSGRLFVEYIDYFKDNLTYFTHTRIHEIFYGFRSYDQITLWFGENILGRSNMNASVGYLTEFTFSLGFFGALLASFIFAAIVFLFDLLDLNIKYVGLVFILTETMRNSLFETSLITNGVFFMILAMIFIIPKNERTIRHVK